MSCIYCILIMVVRNVVGLVPPWQPDANYHGTGAALEYAVRVLGHAQCGGVQAMVEGAPDHARDFVVPWMKIAESVRLSLPNLATFPWIADAVAAGRLTLHGFRFDIRTRLDGDRSTPVA